MFASAPPAISTAMRPASREAEPCAGEVEGAGTGRSLADFDAHGRRKTRARVPCAKSGRRRIARLALGAGRAWRLTPAREHAARSIEPALEAVAAASAVAVALLPQRLQLAAELAQQVQHGLLQLRHPVADDADVAAALAAPGGEVVAERLLAGRELHQRLVHLAQDLPVRLARLLGRVQVGPHRSLERDLALVARRPAALCLRLQALQAGLGLADALAEIADHALRGLAGARLDRAFERLEPRAQ